MAVHKILQILIIKYLNEPTHIFIDCVNVLYLLNTHIQYHTTHNNHLDKTILSSMVHMLQTRTHTTNLYKVRAHVNIQGNEEADKLAKIGPEKIQEQQNTYTNKLTLHHFITKGTHTHIWIHNQIKAPYASSSNTSNNMNSRTN